MVEVREAYTVDGFAHLVWPNGLNWFLSPQSVEGNFRHNGFGVVLGGYDTNGVDGCIAFSRFFLRSAFSSQCPLSQPQPMAGGQPKARVKKTKTKKRVMYRIMVYWLLRMVLNITWYL